MTEIAHPIPSSEDYVLAAKCTLCRCSSGRGPHLSIDLQRVKLDRENAIAISYTWGEFDRRDVYIGHTDLNPDKRMFINLGQEWSIPELWSRLDELSREHNAIWIDQLCVPQTKGEVRDVLAKIPDIYRTLDVVAVLPGPPPCKCCNRWLALESNRWLSLDLNQRCAESFDKLTLMVEGRILQCYNSVAFCSWYRRVWTRQEFFYSRTIRIKWNLTSTPPCVKLTRERALTADEICNLNPYARLFLERVNNSQRDPLAGVRALFIEFQSFITQGGLSTLHYLKDHETQGFGGSHLVFPLFLTEAPLEVGSKSEQIERFLASLLDHSAAERSATVAKDYVVSVWVDCPGYTIPVAYKSMGVLELLEDAIGQLEKMSSITLATTCPHGLLGGTKATVCWRPTNGLQSTSISKSSHLYAPARTDTVLPLKDGLIPLKMLRKTSSSISSRAQDYERTCKYWSTAEALYHVVRAVNNFNADSQHRLMAMRKERDLTSYPLDAVMKELNSEGEALEPGNISTFETMFECLMASADSAEGMPLADLKLHWKGFPELDHHALVYRVVANVLGLHHHACAAAGIRLVIAPDKPAMIGFTAPDVDVDGSKGMLDAAEKALTVWTGPKGQQTVLYEAVRHDNGTGSMPQYRVAGIWVPCKAVKEDEIGAVPCFDDDYDAFLV